MFSLITHNTYPSKHFRFSIVKAVVKSHLFPHVTQHKIMENVVGCVLVSRVATVDWTYVAIYHLSLSTCVGGPAAGIIAIWKQLTVIPSFCLCESSSSPCMPTGTSSLEMTSRAGTKSFGSVVVHIVYNFQLVLNFFVEASQSKPLYSQGN